MTALLNMTILATRDYFSIGSGCCVKEIISSDNVRLFKTAGNYMLLQLSAHLIISACLQRQCLGM